MKIGFYFLIFLSTIASVVVTPAAAQTRPQILAELFDNFGCANCTTPDSNYSNFVTQNPGYGIVVISYHDNFPDLYDEFYKESSVDVNKRDASSYYNVGSDPAAFIDGYLSQSTPANNWKFDTQTDHGFPLDSLTQAPKAAIGTDHNIHITFSATGPASGEGVVRVALKESHIYYVNTDSPGYGNPPDSLWNDVFRAMLPNSTDASPLGPSETRSFDVVFDPSNYVFGINWNTQNMDAVIFVQDVAPTDGLHNYVVESIGVVSLATASGVAENSHSTDRLIIPNPLQANEDFAFELSSPGDVQITVYDLLGREIRTIVKGVMPAGETSVEMGSSVLPAGYYIARLTVDGRESDQSKFIVSP